VDFTEYERSLCSPGELSRTLLGSSLPGKTGIIDTGNEGTKEPGGSFAGRGLLPGKFPGGIIFGVIFYPCPRLELLPVSLSVGLQKFKAPPGSELGADYGYSTRKGKI